MRPTVEQNHVILEYVPWRRELAVNRRLALVQPAARQGSGEQDYLVGLDNSGRRGEPVGKFIGYEVGGERAGLKAGLRRYSREERDVVLHASDIKLVQRAGEPVDGGVAVRARSDELGDQWIVMDADLATLDDPGIEPDSVPGRWAISHKPADRRQEIAGRVLGIDPRFDRPTVEAHILLRDRERLARRDADHQFNEIEAGHQFGDGMLDL